MMVVLATGFVYRCGFLERTVLAVLGMDYMGILAPVRTGDSVSLAMEATDKRDIGREDSGLSSSMPRDQSGRRNRLRGDMTFLVKRRK